jgi:acyl carrier protein
MNQEASTTSRIRLFVGQKFPSAKKKAIGDDTLLLESGVVDSLGMLDVVAFLEQTFGITVTDDELTPDNFGSIASLSAFVENRKSQVEVTAG